MTFQRVPSLLCLAVLLLSGALTCIGWAAEDDDALRKRALALNDVTGSDPIDEQVRSLLKDKEKTKQLLEVAGRMARNKEQPFNYNGAYILGRVSQELRDLDAAEVFY